MYVVKNSLRSPTKGRSEQGKQHNPTKVTGDVSEDRFQLATPPTGGSQKGGTGHLTKVTGDGKTSHRKRPGMKLKCLCGDPDSTNTTESITSFARQRCETELQCYCRSVLSWRRLCETGHILLLSLRLIDLLIWQYPAIREEGEDLSVITSQPANGQTF